MENSLANRKDSPAHLRPEIGVCVFLCMRFCYELYPGEYFLEYRLGSGSWSALSRDNDLDVMKIRFAYQVDTLGTGNSVRLVDWRGKVLKEHKT